MTDTTIIEAQSRSRAGKGTARKLRTEGRTAAVIYGNREAPHLISLESRTFDRLIRRPGFFNHIYDLSVDGTNQRVLPKDIQFDPVSDVPLHVDFLRVGPDTTVVVDVPCDFVNHEQSPGLKRGGVLGVVRHAVQVTCRTADIPETITVDLAGFDVGASIHISAVKLPDGVKPTITDRDFTIATIGAPSGLKSEAA